MAVVSPACSSRGAVWWGVALAVLALIAGAAPSAEPDGEPAAHDAAPAQDVQPTAPATGPEAATDAARKAELLASPRWRRAIHEFDQWLARQPVYPPDTVQRIKADLANRIAGMTSYELEYLLEGLDEKLAILESPAAVDARNWLGRYLSVMADDRRAALLAHVPNVLDLSASDLAAKLADLEKRRTAVEREARDARRARRDFGAFVADLHRGEAAERRRLDRIRRGDVAFSPYRTLPVDAPPFPDSFDTATVVGVGPWGSFVDVCFPAF